jgi:glutathione S-transferase
VDKKHQNHAVQDSWVIAKYLDSAYPDTQPLIQTGNEGLQFFFENYCHGHILLPAFRLCVMSIYHLCPTPSVKHFFRTNREARFNMTLEKFAGEESTHIAGLKSGLGLIHTTLTSYPYLSGDQGKSIRVGLDGC